jgi:hypothetical protein
LPKRKKSNTLDYYQIYRVLLLACIGFLLFISINFFLFIANYISVVLLMLSIMFLCFHFYNKKLNMLIFSFIFCILSLVIILSFHLFSWSCKCRFHTLRFNYSKGSMVWSLWEKQLYARDSLKFIYYFSKKGYGFKRIIIMDK